MRICVILVTAFLLMGILLSSCGLALAQSDDIGYSQIHPAHPFYFLKTIREILELKSSPNNNIKVLRYLEFSTRRIREVNALFKNKRGDLIPQTLEKYWAHLNKLNSLVNINDPSTMRQITDSITQHIRTLESIYDQTDDKRAKMAIRLTINRVSSENVILFVKINKGIKETIKPSSYYVAEKIYLNQILTCNLLTRQASESALNDVEKVVLKERAQNCAATLR
ncbi:hypothetical protein HYT18_00835 [Candidatus Microgenomates bacterium]|nr:hypothetical protein [Candidatus Microgenomates bacterium]